MATRDVGGTRILEMLYVSYLPLLEKVGAYLSEIIRSAIEAVDKGQMEAPSRPA
jgi:ABC-type amino acid transport system permease subunit